MDGYTFIIAILAGITIIARIYYKLSLWQESENGKNFLKKLDEESLAQDNKSAS